MRRFFLHLILVIFVVVGVQSAKAEMDPRMKALGTMAAYGTVGGALLGTASLAFGTNGRAIAQGASLGLYAGIIFGSYVVMSHYTKTRTSKSEGDYYPEAPPSPYEGDAGTPTYENFEGSGGDNAEGGAGSPFRIQNFLNESETRKLFDPFKGRIDDIPFYLNLVNLQF